jgi:hypothetical protein
LCRDADEEQDYLLFELSRECEHSGVTISTRRDLSWSEKHRKLPGSPNAIIHRFPVKGSRLSARDVPPTDQNVLGRRSDCAQATYDRDSSEPASRKEVRVTEDIS